MSSWSIRSRLILLSILPALLASFCLTVYFTWTQLEQISSNHTEYARTTVSHLAASAEYAVFSGNIDELSGYTDSILSNPAIISLTVSDSSGKTLLMKNKQQQIHHGGHWLSFYDDEILVLQNEIIPSETSFQDYEDPEMHGKDSHGESIGTAELVITDHYNNLRKTRTLQRSLLITMGILIISALIGASVSRRIALPVQRLTKVVRRITAGELSARVDLDAPAELGVLEQCINQMAGEIDAARSDVEERIDEFTLELQQTLEELEIRNAELDIARSNALQASNAKSQYLANMSHEIRTPLSGIIGFSELLDNTELDARQKEYASIIHSSSKSLLGIIEEVLDISKIESGKLDIVARECAIEKIIDSIISLLSPVATDKRIELFSTLDDDVPGVILADTLRLQQVLTNLIGNALKFTSQGHVHIRVARMGGDREQLCFTINDTGIGLDEAVRDKLFTAFTQADNTIEQQFGGTGLGLLISRKLTHLMGGEIGFHSTPGEGSSFWFTLPFELPQEGAVIESVPLSGHRFCVVGDKVLTRGSISSRLRRWGAGVVEYRFEQLDNIAESLDDHTACIVNIGINGYSKAIAARVRKLHANPGSIPVIAILGSSHQAEYDALSDAGAATCISLATAHDRLLSILCELAGIQLQHEPEPDHVQPGKQDIDSGFSGCHVLIVDDNETNRKLASIILNKTGLDISTADSGQRALELMEDNSYDIVFMDIYMPDMNGFEVTRHIRSAPGHADAYIIALTAHIMPQEKQKAFDAGFDDIVIKPISEQVVAQVLEQWKQRKPGCCTAPAENDTPGSDITFDIQESLQLASGSKVLALEMTTMFLEQLPIHRRELVEATDSAEADNIKQAVHSLHGASQYCAVPPLRRAVCAFESAVDRGEQDSYTGHLQAVCGEIDRLLVLDAEALFADT